MKIKEFIKILENLHDKEKEIFFESIENGFTTSIDISIDDDNNVRVYEIASE